MIHVKFIQSPSALNKYRAKYRMIPMNNPANSVNVLQLYYSTNPKKRLTTNLRRIGRIGLLLTGNADDSNSEKKKFLESFRLLLIGFYNHLGLLSKNYTIKHNFKNSEYPTISEFVNFLSTKADSNIKKPKMLSFLEELKASFSGFKYFYDGAVSVHTHLFNTIDNIVKKQNKHVVVDLTPFYKAKDVGSLYAVAITTIALFQDYGLRHPNVQLQLDIRNLMQRPHFKGARVLSSYKAYQARAKTKSTQMHKSKYVPRHSSHHIKHYSQPHHTAHMPRHASNLNTSVHKRRYTKNDYLRNSLLGHSSNLNVNVNNSHPNHGNERSDSYMNKKAEMMIKNMYFTDLIQHRFNDADKELTNLKHVIGTNGFQILANDLANQKASFRKFGDDLTAIAEKLYD